MSYTKTHAERELDILLKTTPDAIIRHFVPELIALCDKFGQSGQSGGSAPYTAGALLQAVKKLCLHQPIAPLTGEDDEWMDVSEKGAGQKDMYQNKRYTSVLKHGKDGKAYYLDAIVWQGEEEHDTFTGTINGVSSRQYIKSFPFKPKKFYIDVVKHYDIENYPDHTVVEGDDKYVYTLKDPKQLDEVWKYYDEYKQDK